MKKKKSEEGISYWQTVADALAALLLVVLLVSMLLILYLIRSPEIENVDPYLGDHFTGMEDAQFSDGDHGDGDSDETGRDKDNKDRDRDNDGDESSDDGGGDGGGKPGLYPEEGTVKDGFGKAAVFVQVVDAETDATIKEAGIRFELYSIKNALQVLNTYYPIKIEYREYETTEDGVFYLPEKIHPGRYSLHELNTPVGYDPSDNLALNIKKDYDWPEPYVAKVALYPSKNIIRIKMTDADSHESVEGGVYDVVAATDIVTLDGTVRYKKGEVVEQIECDKDGYGESELLYLGSYLLRQSRIPQYYAGDTESITVKVEKRSGNAEAPIHEILCEETTITVEAVDELYANIPMQSVRFNLRTDNAAEKQRKLKTDEFGGIVLNHLQKNTTYHLEQQTTMDGYSMNQSEYSIHVDEQGRIGGEAKYTQIVQNRTLRASVSVQDQILRNTVSDVNVALFDEAGNLIDTWDSTGIAHEISGLIVGDYMVRLNGQERSQRKITVTDIEEVQYYSANVWTTTGIAAAITLVLLGMGLIFLLVYLIRRRMSHNAEKKKL